MRRFLFLGVKEAYAMEWTEYMIMAAKHSKNDVKLWFRYLRKYIDKINILFSMDEVNYLVNNGSLTPFQRVSLKAAFEEGSPTRQHIISLNQKVIPTKIAMIKDRYERTIN
jgi:hypothetical protein